MKQASRTTAVLIVLMTASHAGADNKPLDEAQKALIGKWTVVSCEANGQKLPKDTLIWQWTFLAEGKAVLTDLKRDEESNFTYSIAPSKESQAIDIVYQGPEPALKGSKQLGIYKLEDNELTVCLNLPSVTERPKKFATQMGSGFLMKLERAKVD